MSTPPAGRSGIRVPAPPLGGTRPLLRAGMVGIARVDVVDADPATGAPPRLAVVLEPADATDLAPWLLDRTGYSLTGGARLHPRIADVEPVPGHTDRVTLRLDGEGDRSTYTLALSGENADPFHSTAAARFRLDCATGTDCGPAPGPAAPEPPSTVRVDYLARDFAGFRRALQGFLPTRMPGWTESSEADVGVMLVELLAATADGFSYVLDRVANEAFLDTATRRRSVAGHLALIGHRLDEGASAATLLQFRVTRPHLLAAGFAVRQQATDERGAAPARLSSDGEDAVVFETVVDALLLPEHNELVIYDWDSPDGYLPAGATSAYLVGDLTTLAAGDALALRDAATGRAEVVRLDRGPERLPATPYGEHGTPPLTRVTWTRATATRVDHPVAETVVQGNLVPATHGHTHRARIVLPAPGEHDVDRGADGAPDTTAFAIAHPAVLSPGGVVLLTVWGLADGQEVVLVIESPLGEREVRTRPQDIAGGLDGEPVTIDSDAPAGIWRALVGATAEDALTAPQAVAVWEVRSAAARGTTGSPGPRLRVPVPGAPLGIDAEGRPQLWATIDGAEWRWVPTLLDSGPRERVFTLEPDDEGGATMLFGQGGTRTAGRGAFGRRPDDGAVVDLRFRLGRGTDGNVPAASLTVPVDDGPATGAGPGGWLVSVTNPLPATGGREPQDLEDARRTGPAAAGDRLVAVTARDYADAVAEFDRSPGGGVISRARAEFRWTGSWTGVDLILDLAAGAELDDRLSADLLAFLDQRRLTGYDLQLLPARDLPLQLALTVCVRPGFLAWSVRQDVAAALRPGSHGGGPRGLFDPENLSFGDPVLLSRLYLAVQAVPGVESVGVDVLAPLDSATPEADTVQVKATGQLTVGRDQIARLDDDPARPERGRLTLVTRGGR